MPSRKATKKSRKLRKLRKTRGRGRRRTQRGGDVKEKCDKTYADRLCNEIKADETPIKDATTLYRQGALNCHPDKNPNDKVAEEAFKTLVNCYEKKKESLEKKKQPANAAPPPAPAQQPGSVPSSGPQPILRRSSPFSYIELTIPEDIWEKIWDTSTYEVKQSIRDRLKEKFGTLYDDSDYQRGYSKSGVSFRLKPRGQVKVLLLDGKGRVFIMVLNTENLHPDIKQLWSKEVKEMYDQLIAVSREETS